MRYIWQLSVIQLEATTIISGVALEGVPYHFEKNITPIKNLFALMRGYGVPVSKNKKLEVEISNKRHAVETNYKGDFKLIVEGLVSELPKIHNEASKEPLPILQHYPILFEKSSSKYDVISD